MCRQGAKDCEASLDDAVQAVVDGHLADVITNSWGTNGGDLIAPPNERKAFDNVLLMAAGTGIGVQFSSGDEGDEFVNLGASVADYPPSSPYATAVGGTSLQVGAANARLPAGKQADVRVDYINEVDATAGTLTSVRTLDFEGQEEFCGKPAKRCSEQQDTLHAKAGYDNMTGIGSPAPGFIPALVAH